jgi:Flp pilus assembly pilin Flp
MTLRRRDEGQAATEYAGILTVIALIFVALITLGLGDRVSGSVKSARRPRGDRGRRP